MLPYPPPFQAFIHSTVPKPQYSYFFKFWLAAVGPLTIITRLNPFPTLALIIFPAR